ncbi:unnamed protein product [Linum tenue]|uniref:Uncharacterized protein n=1 Tax=Linum tenue TaxID=586396 RepID=A0AAV0JUL2_9ROSI|nr:unnamed protein product [Linum tenue]
MEEDPAEFSSGGPPLVSLSSFPPARRRRRLSSCCYNFAPVASCGTMAWLSLQGRTVNAEEASSSKSIGFLGKEEEALAWELVTPIQRFLIVAVIGVAASESRKNRTISQLNKSVELRDELLSSMQQKLDSLCLQMANINVDGNNKDDEEEEFLSSMGFVDCGCWHCDQHQQELFGGGTMGLMKGAKACGGDEAMELKRQLSKQDEQEERRMSDLSDWASSSASGSEFQISNFMVDQDTCNLKRICEEKDVTIKELTDVLQLTDKAGAKRLSELEDIICRKNAMITRLKKDIVVLEQKVVTFTLIRLEKVHKIPTNMETYTKSPMVVKTENLFGTGGSADKGPQEINLTFHRGVRAIILFHDGQHSLRHGQLNQLLFLLLGFRFSNNPPHHSSSTDDMPETSSRKGFKHSTSHGQISKPSHGTVNESKVWQTFSIEVKAVVC